MIKGYHSNSGDKCMCVSFLPLSFRVTGVFLLLDGRDSDSRLYRLLLALVLSTELVGTILNLFSGFCQGLRKTVSRT